jgi:hypothetical protein
MLKLLIAIVLFFSAVMPHDEHCISLAVIEQQNSEHSSVLCQPFMTA